MISGTNADCKILETHVSGTMAYVTCLVFSHKPAEVSKGFRFWICDSDGSQDYADECVYWIDSIGDYDNDLTNVDVNQYREVILKIDLTKGGTSSLSGNRWSRKIYVGLRPAETTFAYDLAWKSDWLDFVSSPFEIPKISSIGFRKQDGKLFVRFRNKYTPKADFALSNANTYTRVALYDIATGDELESQEVYVGDSSSIVSAYETTEVPADQYDDLMTERYEGEKILKRTKTESAIAGGQDSEIEIGFSGNYDNILKVVFQTYNAKGELLGGTARYVDMALSATRLFVMNGKTIEEAESVSVLHEGKPIASLAMPYMKPFSFPAPYIFIEPDGQNVIIAFDNEYYDEIRVEIYVRDMLITSTTRSGHRVKTSSMFINPETYLRPERIYMSDFFLYDVTVKTTYVKGPYIKIIEERRPMASMIAVCGEDVYCSEYLYPLVWGEEGYIDVQ